MKEIEIHEGLHYLLNGNEFIRESEELMDRLTQSGFSPAEIDSASQGTMAMQILSRHNQASESDVMKLKFEALVSPDNNYVSILQTVRAAGIREYPVPYILTNCHNSYCAVSGTSNEDDHVFGLGCQKKYGGLFVPRYCAVLHQYIRESVAGCGKMVLGSDSHTRYGALGTLGIGEGGGEVAKQLMGVAYNLTTPEIIAIELTGKPAPGVGPHDVALALIAAVQPSGFVKNRILEFVGPGIASLDMDFRMSLDAMTTEAGGLSSIWQTDALTEQYLMVHSRGEDFATVHPANLARYNGLVRIDLSKIEPMIALPFHPSVAYMIRELNENPVILEAIDEAGKKLYGDRFSISSKLQSGRLRIDQALISGCTGGLLGNICGARDVLKGFTLSSDSPMLGINPASMQVTSALYRQGIATDLQMSGAILYPPGCGSCFGVTDIPANGQLSARHVTRNFAGREGAQKGKDQFAMVALMDSRSIAATLRNGGCLTPATDLSVAYTEPEQIYDAAYYEKRVYNGYRHPLPETEVPLGPGISNWPHFDAFPEHLVFQVTGMYSGAVTTDDLIPSGEASSLRSNPMRLSEYLLSGRDHEFVTRGKELCAIQSGEKRPTPEMEEAIEFLVQSYGAKRGEIKTGGLLCAEELGEGSSREQAVSCQRILGGMGNLAKEYPTKRYRTNCLNWGILPMRCDNLPYIQTGDILVLPEIAEKLRRGEEGSELLILKDGRWQPIAVTWGKLTKDELRILLAGCIINDFCNS